MFAYLFEPRKEKKKSQCKKIMTPNASKGANSLPTRRERATLYPIEMQCTTRLTGNADKCLTKITNRPVI